MNKLSEKKVRRSIWKDIRTTMLFVTIILSLTAMASAGPSVTKYPTRGPLQDSIKEAVSNGSFSSKDIVGSPEYSTQILEKKGNHLKLRSTTKITFKQPKGAGYGNNKWPKFVDKGIVKDDKVKNAILADIQKIPDANKRSDTLKEWNKYDFETGERTYTINETYEVNYTDASSSFATMITTGTFSNDILMGFTQTTPVINWVWTADIYVPFIFWKEHVASINAGTTIDGAIGLRLPTSVKLNMPKTMLEENSYSLSTSIMGADWNAAQYSLAKVPAENGNEFVARFKFFFGIQMWLIGIGNLGPYIDTNLDYSKSYKTPIGPNERFPLPIFLSSPNDNGIKIQQFGAYIGLGLKISPDISSGDIIANWAASGDAIGKGSIDYHLPGINYAFGSVKAGDYDKTTNYANIRLSDYKYYFSSCRLTLSGNIQTGGWLPFMQSGYKDLYSIGCSGLTGGLYLGIHPGTTANHVDGNALVKMQIIPDYINITTAPTDNTTTAPTENTTTAPTPIIKRPTPIIKRPTTTSGPIIKRPTTTSTPIIKRPTTTSTPITKRPTTAPTPVTTNSIPISGSCDPSYPTVCIKSPPPDLNCIDIPYKNFKVLQPDPHRFDADKDGIGCEK